MESNPYTTPVASGERTDLFAGSGLVSGAAIQKLAATKPWVRLISVISFIGSGFMLLGAGSLALVGTVGSFAAARSSGSVLPAGFGIGMAVAYAVFAIIYLYPGVKLWKYASSIARLMQTQSEADLVAALDQQRGFWKFIGVMVTIIIGLYILAMVLMVIGFAGAAAFAKP
jgi:hypothetical protein